MFIMSEINVIGERKNEREKNEKEDKKEDKTEDKKENKKEDKKEDKTENKKEDKKEDGEEKKDKKEKGVGIEKNTAEKVDTINDDNAICLCLRNILTSTFEKDSEHFWTEKTRELKTFIAKKTKSNESENEEWDNKILPTHIKLDSWNEVCHKNETVNTNAEEQKPFLKLRLETGEEKTDKEREEETKIEKKKGKEKERETETETETETKTKTKTKKEKEEERETKKEKGKEKKKMQRKKRKRNYVDIEKVHFDFDDKDFAMNENDKIINMNYFNEFEEHVSEFPKWDNATMNNNHCNTNWDDWINMEDKSVKTIITPPKIPFNERFRKMNKEISELYIKSEKGTKYKKEMNIFLSAQLKCLETIESFEKEHSSISEHFDKAIMEKLQITEVNEMDGTGASNKQNKNLTKLLEYLMSWYFAGFYVGRMSSQKL